MRNRFLVLAVLVLQIPAAAQVATGGPYALEKTVLAGGGGQSAAGPFSLEKTIGQAIAGTTSNGGGYSVAGGFWTAGPSAPTAANASIRGRVTDRSGRGIALVNVILMGGTLTTPRLVTTSTFGHFALRDVPVGHFYVLSVQHRRYTFAPATYTFSLDDELTGVEFQAQTRP